MLGSQIFLPLTGRLVATPGHEYLKLTRLFNGELKNGPDATTIEPRSGSAIFQHTFDFSRELA
jgi:hypothetical protein